MIAFCDRTITNFVIVINGNFEKETAKHTKTSLTSDQHHQRQTLSPAAARPPSAHLTSNTTSISTSNTPSAHRTHHQRIAHHHHHQHIEHQHLLVNPSRSSHHHHQSHQHYQDDCHRRGPYHETEISKHHRGRGSGSSPSRPLQLSSRPAPSRPSR